MFALRLMNVALCNQFTKFSHIPSVFFKQTITFNIKPFYTAYLYLLHYSDVRLFHYSACVLIYCFISYKPHEILKHMQKNFVIQHLM